MKRFYKFLMPLVMIMALALPWQMRAQGTLTVANGTETNSYIPIYGLWTDAAQHNQILYPASMLNDMSGSAVTQLTWYMSSTASDAWGTTVTIKMTEVSATSLSGHLPTTDATTVWTGVLNGTSSPITITFDVPYVYTGSNLLIDVTTTAATYSSCSWYGVSQSNASYYQYTSSGSQSFLPKTTFVYSPASNICMPPTNVAATVTGSDADITWTEGDGSAWEIVWGTGSFNPDTVTINTDYASSGSYSLTNLPDGPYNVYVRTDCGNNEYSVWRLVSFYINANGCMIGINGSDSYGDGWNGGSLAIVQGGTTVATFTLSSGSSGSATYPVTGSMPVNFVWSSGSYDSEVSFSIIDGGGATVYSASNPSAGTVYTMTDPCPSCFAPQGLEVVTLTPDSITFTWLPGGDETAWEVSNGIDTIEIYDTVYTFGGLTSNTLYSLSVRSICDVDDTSAWISINVRTACSFIDSLPYTTSFESASTGSSTDFTFGDPCWTLTTDATQYPYVYVSSSSSYAHSGSKGIYWYRSSSTGSYGSYQCLVMPGVAVDEDHPISALQLKFWAKASSSSEHPIFQVGVMTNPGDINTFTTVGTVDINGVTDWTEYVVGLNGYTGTGNFVAIRANYNGSYWYAYVDDFTLEVAPNCPPITHIYTEGTSTSGAYLTWTLQEGLSGVPEEYEIEYVATDDSTATVATTTTTDPYVFLSGLTPNTDYTFRVRVDCGDDDYSPWDSTTFKTAGFGCLVFDSSTVDTLAITGGSASTSYYIPIGNYYNYSYTQQLILASEMNGGSMLTGIDFQYSGSSASTAKTNATIYLANVSTSSLSSSFVPYDASTFVPVYTGALNCTVGWNHFEFDTPFPYDGTSNLLIVVHDNSGDYDGTAYSFTTHSASGMSRYVQNDGSAYNINTVSGGISYAYRVNMKLYGGTCQTIATCAAPVAGVTTIDSTSVIVSWAPGYDETAWDVYYRIYGDSVWTSAATGVTATSYNYTNLNPGTNYEFRVSNNCSEGDFSTVVSATTACAAFHLPLTENFENVASGVYEPQCWVNGSTHLGTNYPNPLVVSLTGDPNKLLLFYNGGYLILPQVAAPLNQLQVRFKFVQGGDNVHFLMGLMPNQDMPIDSIIVLDTLVRSDIDTSTSTVFITYSLATIDPDYNNYHLAFWDAFNENYSFIDDLVVEYIPQCASVSGLSATATTNTATISWATDASSASGYIIEYGPRGFQLGTGTTTTATSSPATITGLAHSTNYDAYVYTICASLNDTSTVSPVVEFATECDVITTLPYSTTFEHILPPGSGSSVVMVPNCWATSVINSGTAPRIYYTSTTAMAPSPSYCLYFYDLGVAALPQMSMPLDSLMLSFHAYNATPASYGLIIGAVDSITPGYAASFTPIDTVVFQYGNNNEYNLVSFLTNYNGSANHLAIRNYNVDSTATYATIYLDNLTVDYIPSCIAPQRVHTSMLTNVAADLEWTISNAPNYSIEYGPHGFTPGTGTPLTSTTNSVSLTGLTPLTQYDVRLVSLCSATETSDTTVFTFTTLRAAPVTNYPYYCDFTDSAMAAAWEPVNTTALGWAVGTAANSGVAAGQSLYVSTDNGATNSYNNSSAAPAIYAYRTFAMQPGAYNISFDWMANGESSWDYLRAYLVPADMTIQAGIAPDGGTSTYNNATAAPQAGWIAIGSKLNLQTSWQNYNEDITIANAGSYSLVFYWGNDGSGGSQPPAAVDNVSVSRNVCPIDNIQASNVTGSSATVTWTGNSDEYQVEYGISGFSQGTQVTTTTPTISLTGLTSLTPYQVKVRGICNGGTDTSRWYSYVFSTDLCDNPTVAINWDTTMADNTSSYSPIGYCLYNYSYVQTIIDSAQMADVAGDITAFAYYPTNTTSSNYYTNMDVYMANVPENNLTASFILPDSTNHVFVQVLDNADLNFTTTGEQIVSLTAPFTWDGHSNVLIAINRKHGGWSSSGSFASHTHSASKMRYVYTDNGAYDINTVTGGTAQTNVGDIKLISCGAGCAAPSALTTTNVTYNAATITWSGSDSTEVGIHQGLWDETGVNFVTVTNHTYTFTGLVPNTQYTVAARTLCEDNMTSNWTFVTFTTEDLPCFAPSNIQVSNQTTNGGKVTWTPGGNETEWIVNVFRTGIIDTNITVINTPMCNISGLYAATSYTISVGSVCGGIDTVWCDTTATLTTTACLPPTNVEAVANGHNAMVTWTSSGANEYHVLWYLEDFTTGADSVVVENGTTNATITGLAQGETYDIYVFAYCDGQRSAQAGQTQVTITGIDDINSSLINLYPNPANTTVTVDGIQGEAIVTIVDMNGRTVFSEKAVDKLTIDLNGMAQGAYFVRITGEKTSAIRKLIVK